MKMNSQKKPPLFPSEMRRSANLMEEIRTSRERAEANGIDPETSMPRMVSRRKITEIRRSTKQLYVYTHSIASAYEHRIYDLADAWILLFSSEGVLLKIFGSGNREWLTERGICRWTSWREEEIGPNVFSLGNSIGRSVCRIGPENYLHSWKDCSFYYSPIRPGSDSVPGGIALLTRSGSYERYALNFVEAVCRSVELQYHWFDFFVTTTNVVEGIGFLALDQSLGQNHILTMSSEVFSILGLERDKEYYEFLERYIDPLPANQEFWGIVNERRNVGEKTLPVTVRGKRYSLCIGTSRFEAQKFHMSGLIVIFHSYSKIQRLASRYTTSVVRFSFDDIIGASPLFIEAVQQSKIVAESDSNILLLGESGVGKDVLAQAIHNWSSRRKGPFVAVNCASFSKELIGSELFGYEEGAFTGARRGGSIGKFELASGGTLFLDEIGDMPNDLQAVLLRVLEERSFMKVGGSRMIRVDVRIIAATNKNIAERVQNGLFREDLFYRLGIVRIHVPPLRQRGDDVLLLTDYFITSICTRQNKPLIRLSDATRDFFVRYPWPGNVRELQNLLEGIISTQNSSMIEMETVQRYLGFQSVEPTVQMLTPAEPEEKARMRSALCMHRNNRTKAAQEIGMSRRTFYRRLKEYGLDQ